MSAFSVLSDTTLPDLNIPLYERVRLSLQKRLVEQAWDPNHPIPTEQVLAKEYEVSIGTVRKAIERLVHDGLLYKAQGRGTYIKQPNFSNSLLRFFRYSNEQGEQIVPVGSVKSIKIVEPIAFINQKLALANTTKLIQLERIRLVNSVVVLSENIWLPEPLFSQLGVMKPTQFANLLYPFYYEHCGQFVQMATETLSFTSTHTDPYLPMNESGFLIKIERVAYNLESKPIEYRTSYGHPQNFSYHVRIT